MCYSALVRTEHRKFEREFGVQVSLRQYYEMFWRAAEHSNWLRIPKAMREEFASPASEEEQLIAQLIVKANADQARIFEAELFQQKTRLTTAERALAEKPTKKAESDRRISTDKIARAQRNLTDLQRTELLPRDARIFPGHFAPVIIERDGQRHLVPMRYQCRLPGWTGADERKRPGTYNARRDNLRNAWRNLYGYQHGVMVATGFYENVARHRAEHRELAPGEPEGNVVLEFKPEPEQDMLVACLWSYTKDEEGEGGFFSFAAITDEPPPEVSAAGHDRCIVPIKREHLDAWLRPDPTDFNAIGAILDDRAPMYFGHRLAA
ncbi:SOS response-associated peptidase family protein [Cupriavidus malaysiensis]|uniref:Abasic site processing protein n=1 Tax=Cupriavidus malaysiensis TaxID=367825 RepID=A0ABM6FGS0_9BURK|nr:SOS response-associated peptidase family protein [Cupriavidus malaysiensis]AOZ11144.1 hypothetical protein BKK80_34890 [Cupriavidus malaysiensis]